MFYFNKLGTIEKPHHLLLTTYASKLRRYRFTIEMFVFRDNEIKYLEYITVSSVYFSGMYKIIITIHNTFDKDRTSTYLTRIVFVELLMEH